MAKKNYIRHNITNVEAIYPRIDKPYHFDSVKQKSVTCNEFDDGAAYTTSFNMTKEQAVELFKLMSTAWDAGRQDGWPEKIEMPFKKLDDGRFQGKARLAAAYGENATRKPSHYDAKGIKLDEDFQLTSGSTVNINVELVPYKMSASSVSLRLRAVQVVELAQMAEANPFGEVAGYSSVGEDDNPFGETAPVVAPVKENVPVPTTKARKNQAVVEPKKDASELDDILSQFNDEVDD
jgi:hypothetical protein